MIRFVLCIAISAVLCNSQIDPLDTILGQLGPQPQPRIISPSTPSSIQGQSNVVSTNQFAQRGIRKCSTQSCGMHWIFALD